MANSILYAQAGLRADAGVLMRNRRGQSGLWVYAISLDLVHRLCGLDVPDRR